MTTVYVDVDSYLDLVIYAANDTITARYGAILTIRESNATQPFQITTTDSVIKATTAQRKLVFAAGGYVNAVPSDIGLPVVGATTGDSGTLVDYDNATRIWHVLRDDPTDDFFDNASEAISITGGTGAGTLSALPDQAVIVKFNSTNNSGFIISGNGKLMTRGDWYPLGIGDGSASQTFAFYGTEACPYVQVETGSGTGVWTDCRCIYNTAFSSYGAGIDYGDVFQHAPDAGTPIANLTFGDGANGMVVPNGARVRCPDVYITSAATYTTTVANRSRVYYATSGGTHDYINVIFSDRFILQISYTKSFVATYLGIFARSVVAGISYVNISHLTVSKDRAVSGGYGVSISYFASGEFEYLNAEVYGCDAAVGAQAIQFSVGANFIADYIKGVHTQRSGASTYSHFFAVQFSGCFNYSVDHITAINGEVYFAYCQSPAVVNRIKFSDSLTGTKITTNACPIVFVSYCDKIRIDDIQLLTNGVAPYDQVVRADQLTGKLIVTNISFNPDSRTAYLMYLGSGNESIFANCNMSGTMRSSHINATYATKGCRFSNLMFGSAFTTAITPSRARVEGLVSGANLTAVGTIDTPYALIYDTSAKLTGYIELLFSPPVELSYYTRLAGVEDVSIYFNNSGRLYMKSIDDQCTWEIPYLIQGVSGFVNSAPTIAHATWSGNCTQEYAIKSGQYGAEWSEWTAVTGANLAAETVDSEIGFYLKFRFTMTGAHATNNYVEKYMLAVNTDPAFVFPVGYVDLILRGVVEGSSYYVYSTTDAKVLGQGIASYTTSGPTEDIAISVPYDFDDSEIDILVYVRKGSSAVYYEPWGAIASYNEDGVVVFVAQQEDDIVTSDLTAPITFDLVNKLIIVADTVSAITVQDLVNAIRNYETTNIDEVSPFALISGKDTLETGTLYTSITLELIDDWRVQFEARPGPTYVSCRITGGNLIATNDYDNDPICPSAYVTVTRAMSSSGTLLSSSAPTVEEIDTRLSSMHGSGQWQKTRQYP